MKKVATAFALIAASTVVSLVLAELALRVLVPDQPLMTVPDPLVGNFRRPSLSFRYTGEGDAWVSINRHGERDIERNEAKPSDTWRIAILGDSYAEAFQVDLEETFWSILETKLNDCNAFGRRIEVLNFGVSSHGTGQQLVTLRHRVWQFDPDMVLLAFLTGNDVRNNSKRLETEAPLRPFFVLDGEGRLQLDQSFLDDPRFVRSRSLFFTTLRNWSDRLRLLQLVSRARVAASQRGPSPGGDAVGASRSEHEPSLDDEIYLDTRDERWEEAWRITELILAQMNREVRDRRAEFRVVTLSNGIQVNPETDRTERFAKALGITDIFLPDKRVAAIGEKYGFPVLLLAPSLQRIARGKRIYMHGFGSNLGAGHWNQNGHRHAAELIAAELCTSGSVSGGGGA